MRGPVKLAPAGLRRRIRSGNQRHDDYRILARRRRWSSNVHDRAFAFFKGTCRRGFYDNMKTAVETVFIGKDRLSVEKTLRAAQSAA